MLWYILKLMVLLPLIGLMIWGSLKLARKMQGQFGAAAGGNKAVRVVETTMLSPTLRLAVIEFHGREILVSTSRNGLTRLAEAPARSSDETKRLVEEPRRPTGTLAELQTEDLMQ